MMGSGRFPTRVIHAGEPRPPVGGAVTPPIYQSSTYIYENESEYDDVRYIRLSNTPNHRWLAAKLANLEGAEDAAVFASGMAAITATLLAVVGNDGHLIAQESLYGGTHHFLREYFEGFGRRVSFLRDNDRVADLIKPDTKAVYVESVSNPLLKIRDLNAVVSDAKQANVLTIIDNTFPSPVNFNPIHLGFDLVIHSATKYLNGHTDIVGGCVSGQRGLIRKITKMQNYLGGSMDPHACFLLHRGLKTLVVRVRYQNESAQVLAGALEASGKFRKVIYPGLVSHADHARAKEYFRGFGGMLSLEFDGDSKMADDYLQRLKIPFIAPSLGGVETLVTRPVTTSHSGVPKIDLKRLGISDSLIRISVGLEDTDDLIADFIGNL